MASPTPGRSDHRNDAEERAQPPIRWPRPTRRTLVLVALWAVGLALALLVPAAIVSPAAPTAPTADVLLAFGTTLLGAAVMLTAATLLWRPAKDAAILVIGVVPAVACVVGGVILALSKLGS